MFSVTDEPAIRSCGYSFCFKTNMLLPHWLGDDHVWSFDDDLDQEEASHSWTTTIMLPFNAQKLSSFDATKFDVIEPSLLLFLNKLREITVANSCTLEHRVMRRTDHEDGTVEISHNGGCDKYFVFSQELAIDESIKRCEQATMTRLECAFPLEHKQKQRPPSCQGASPH